MIFDGLPFFSGKTKENELKQRNTKNAKTPNSFLKASDDLRKTARQLEQATKKLHASLLARQEAMKKLARINSSLQNRKPVQSLPVGTVRGVVQGRGGTERPPVKHVTEAQLYEIYREACLNLIDTDRTYYFKLRDHSVFLSAMYKRHMGNLRYYDQEFRKLRESDRKRYRFSEIEAFVANQVILTVNQIGREKFIKDGHQSLYSKLCDTLQTSSPSV